MPIRYQQFPQQADPNSIIKMSSVERKSCMKGSSSSRGRTSEKKSVQWQGSCRVRPFIMVGENDRADIWYQQHDYREFKKERKAAATLAKTMGVEAIEETNFVSCRGIEYMVDEDRLVKKVEAQHSACAAVLKAQFKIFKKADLVNEEPDLASSGVISSAYAPFSRQAHFEASQRALQQWKSSQVGDEEEEELPPPEDEKKPTSITIQKKSKKSESTWNPLPGRSCAQEDLGPPRRSTLRKAMTASVASR